jgi:hypothetical protein
MERGHPLGNVEAVFKRAGRSVGSFPEGQEAHHGTFWRKHEARAGAQRFLRTDGVTPPRGRSGDDPSRQRSLRARSSDTGRHHVETDVVGYARVST